MSFHDLYAQIFHMRLACMSSSVGHYYGLKKPYIKRTRKQFLEARNQVLVQKNTNRL